MEKEIVLQERYDENTIVISPRELSIIEDLSNGLNNAEIGKKISLSVRTVESIRQDLLDKTGHKNFTHLVASFLRRGLIK